MSTALNNIECSASSKHAGNSIALKVCLCAAVLVLTFCGSAGAQDRGKIGEEVIARVNNDAITRGDLDHARMQMQMEVEQECQGCSPAQIKEKEAALEKNLLRDL